MSSLPAAGPTVGAGISPGIVDPWGEHQVLLSGDCGTGCDDQPF